MKEEPEDSDQGSEQANSDQSDSARGGATTGFELMRQYPLMEHSDVVYGVTFSPDGLKLASCSRIIVKLWNVADGTLQSTLDGHEWDVLGTNKRRGQYAIKDTCL